jgi:hypothetical protein
VKSFENSREVVASLRLAALGRSRKTAKIRMKPPSGLSSGSIPFATAPRSSASGRCTRTGPTFPIS